jgi:hypothetical protein
MKRIGASVAVMVVVVGVPALRSYAGEDARIQKGKVWYEEYCTPCHGAGGAPGSAVFAGTKRPIDLRSYQQRNGGTFPSMSWWDVTFSPQPGAVHTKVWETIRNDQSVTHALDSDRSRELERTIAARGIVANIEMYVMSIQKTHR